MKVLTTVLLLLSLVVVVLLAGWSNTVKRVPRRPRPLGLGLRRSHAAPSQKWTTVYPVVGVELTTPNFKKFKQVEFHTTKPDGGWEKAQASWYGPGLYGRHTASGAILTKAMRNFAHRKMPFGTEVEFFYRGKRVKAVCNDRGPFIMSRDFDLGPGTAAALGFDGVHTIYWRHSEGR